MRPSWGITLKYAKRLYISVALPKVLYAINIWCTPHHGTEAGPRIKGSVAVAKWLTTVQRAGTITITGSLCTSPTNLLDFCTFTFPVKLLIEKWCYRAVVRLSTLSIEHPLYKLVKASVKCVIKRHKAPMHNLMKIFRLDPNSITITKIAIAVHNPLEANRIPMQISIAKSKEESKREANRASEAVKVYSDGSEANGKVGAATILIKPVNHLIRCITTWATQRNTQYKKLSR